MSFLTFLYKHFKDIFMVELDCVYKVAFKNLQIFYEKMNKIRKECVFLVTDQIGGLPIIIGRLIGRVFCRLIGRLIGQSCLIIGIGRF